MPRHDDASVKGKASSTEIVANNLCQHSTVFAACEATIEAAKEETPAEAVNLTCSEGVADLLFVLDQIGLTNKLDH